MDAALNIIVRVSVFLRYYSSLSSSSPNFNFVLNSLSILNFVPFFSFVSIILLILLDFCLNFVGMLSFVG